MSRKLINEPIRTLEEGDSSTAFGLVTKKALRQDKNGRDYLDMQIADASGSITAKAWSDSPALTAKFDVHDFVAYKGTVHRFRDQLQLNVRECRRVTEADRDLGFQEALIIPSTRYDVDELDTRLREIYSSEIRRPILARLAAEALASHGEALKEHPAAKTIHHAYRGGLLEHVVSMAELAIRICDHYNELDKDMILIGVLFHDLGKLEEIGAMPVNDYTTVGRLVGHVVIGRDLLRERCAEIADFPVDLQTHLEHLILSHQGRLEYGSPVQPMTAEAITLHFIDDLDSKLAQLRQGRETGESLQYFQGFGRYLYADFAPADEEAPGEVDETPEESAPDPDQPTLDL
jgi:3'-5' exoribonuclease